MSRSRCMYVMWVLSNNNWMFYSLRVSLWYRNLFFSYDLDDSRFQKFFLHIILFLFSEHKVERIMINARESYLWKNKKYIALLIAVQGCFILMRVRANGMYHAQLCRFHDMFTAQLLMCVISSIIYVRIKEWGFPFFLFICIIILNFSFFFFWICLLLKLLKQNWTAVLNICAHGGEI